MRLTYLSAMAVALTATALLAQEAPRARTPRPARPAREPAWPRALDQLPTEPPESPLPPAAAWPRWAPEPPELPFSWDWPDPAQAPIAALPPDWAVTPRPPGAGWDHLDLPEPPAFHFNRQGTPEDSLYRAARELLNRGEYRRASDLFHSFGQRFPNSRFVPAAMYWQAFSLYRVGSEPELRQALRVLDEQRQRYPDVSAESDVSALKTRVVGALAAHGDPEAAKRVKADAAQGVQSCDREDMEVRAEALSALVQADPAAASAVLRRILARRDECTVPLRRRAVYLIAREGMAGGVTDLLEVAKNDPDASVRADAIGRLAQIPGDSTVRALEQLLAGTDDERVQRAAIQALRRSENADAGRILRRVIEREDLSESVRAEAIRSLARRSCCGPYAVTKINGQVGPARRSEPGLTESDASYLRSLYNKSSSRALKATILETLAGAGGGSIDQWLSTIVRNPNEDLRNRVAALGRLRRSDAPVEELGKLYDALSERELRYSIIGMLGEREEPAATDKLIEIARAGTDPALRRGAIGALARKKDPRTTKLLLELVEKEK